MSRLPRGEVKPNQLEIMHIFHQFYDLSNISPDCILSLRYQGEAITNYENLSPSKTFAVPSESYNLLHRSIGLVETKHVVTINSPVKKAAQKPAMPPNHPLANLES